MKLKKLLFSGLLFIIIFVIYLITSKSEIYYVSFGDYLAKSLNSYNSRIYGYNEYILDYFKEKKLSPKSLIVKDYETGNSKEIYNSILNNINYTNNINKIKTSLTKSKFVVLSISHDKIYELSLNTEFDFDKEINNIEFLIKEVKKYAKNDIMILNYYLSPLINNEESKSSINSANRKLYELANEYKLCYIDIEKVLNSKELFDNPKNNYPNQEGYKVIAEEIIKVIDNSLLNKTCKNNDYLV